jgi:protein-tyrosine phosphatase
MSGGDNVNSWRGDYRSRIYPITRSIWLGPFAGPQRRPALSRAGMTHILNVGEAPSVLAAGDDSLREVSWHAITDLERMPDEVAIACLQTLHRMVSDPVAKVYVHCVAGWNRSPTIVWLYLVACGVSPDRARHIIEMGAPDAIPAHARLVDAELVELVQQFGRQTFLPHPRPEALESASAHC